MVSFEIYINNMDKYGLVINPFHSNQHDNSIYIYIYNTWNKIKQVVFLVIYCIIAIDTNTKIILTNYSIYFN